MYKCQKDYACTTGFPNLKYVERVVEIFWHIYSSSAQKLNSEFHN